MFVLTHHAHDPVEMAGGTTFHFVTGGVEEALRLAREVGDGDVHVAVAASTVRQLIALDALDELSLDIAPVVLGAGERLFDGSVQPALELLRAGALTPGDARALRRRLSSRLRIFPVEVIGRASTNCTTRGYL